jgi:serine/threonine protein kinase
MSQDNVVNQILFDKYKVTKRINNGSFGVVYLGHNIRTKEQIAIKMVKSDKEFKL